MSRAAQPYQRPSASRSAGRARGASAQPDSLGSQAELERLEHALRLVAELLLVDPVYAPIFRRLEQEIAIERARLSDDILARARSIIRQSAIGSSMDRTSASEPPSP